MIDYVDRLEFDSEFILLLIQCGGWAKNIQSFSYKKDVFFLLRSSNKKLGQISV